MSISLNTARALKRIKDCSNTKATFLDLGDLALTSLPEEIATLSEHLEILIFGMYEWDEDRNQARYETTSRRPSPITCIDLLKDFINLHTLNLESTDVHDLTIVKNLHNLRSLILSSSKVTDLSPLKNHQSLQSLDLYYTNIHDLSCLGNLPGLRMLNLGGTKISDFSCLKNFPGLRKLDLYRTKITDLSLLKDLPKLHKLDLRFTRVTDFMPLKDLTRLQFLQLESTQITDLTLLKDLTRLWILELGSTQVADLRPLKDLHNLRSLGLSSTQVVDLAPLKDLPRLALLHLNSTRVTDLIPLRGLPKLYNLQLRSTQVADLTPLKDLTRLWILELTSTLVTDLKPLESIESLRILWASNTNIYAIPPQLIEQLESLSIDQLQDGTPSEILSKFGGLDCCLSRIRSYRSACSKGKLIDIELKVFILGNAQVGKTQITRFLRGLPFEPKIPTTHGVQIHRLPFPLNDGDKTHLNIWDFGGQDIYHSTHSFFLRSQALFLLLWNPESEEIGEFEESGIAMRNERLPYWTEYIRSQSDSDTPVLIIQSQCESSALESPSPPVDLSKLTGFKRNLVFGAESQWGADTLMASLKDAVQSVRQSQSAPIILEGWAKLKIELLRQLNEEERPLLSKNEFLSLCEEVGNIDDPDLALHYLHHNGILYYDSKKIPDQIILDQNYALTPIYDLFDRHGCYQKLRDLKQGRFTRADLGLFLWNQKGYSSSEQKLFLRFMVSCGICFPTGEKRGEQPEYLSPDLLPERPAIASFLIGRWESDSPKIQRTEFQFTFLHRGVVRDLLAQIGKQAGRSPVYWRDGCWFYEERTHCSAQITVQPQDNGAGTIVLEIQGQQTSQLLKTISMILNKVVGHEEFTIVHEQAMTSARPEKGDGKEATLRISADHPDRQKEVFISYAWGDETPEGIERSETVRLIDEGLQNRNFHVRRDNRELSFRDEITTFMNRIGKADRVVVILSEKYLKSPYCMYELLQIYQRSGSDKEEFLSHIIPVILDDTKISSLAEKLNYGLYWKEKCAKVSQIIGDGNGDVLGVEGMRQYQFMRDFSEKVSDMLHHINDVLSPRGFESIKVNLDSFLDSLK
ncbi:MAG: internalin A [Akkermansiaceae bacterium]|jgi:internalin A